VIFDFVENSQESWTCVFEVPNKVDDYFEVGNDGHLVKCNYWEY
jgi:hypothetical protein